MRRVALSFVCCLAVLFLFSFTSAAVPALRVNEPATKVSLEDDRASITLAIENSSAASINARIKIELVDTQDRVRASAERDASINRGRAFVAIEIELPVRGMSKRERSEMLWYRLRYVVAAKEGSRDAGSKTEGIISLSEITPGLFDLRVAGFNSASEGEVYCARVIAIHPTSSRAVRGVIVRGEMEIDEKKIKASAITGADGYAALDFRLPAKVEADEAELNVTGRLAGLEQSVELEIDFNRYLKIQTSTDKPLYQPGQTLHMRALVFDMKKRAVAGEEATLKIYDPENSVVFRATMKTTRFGVASADWPIPVNARLGQYMISVETDDGESMGGQYVTISRYDLPNFAVSVKPDRAYYLPGQRAEVTVSGDYLFGQPVKSASVRVVRETERKWNYREQKWDVEEADKYEGRLDGQGRFVARIDLAKEHEDISDEDYLRFRDISYAAYVTDETTNRTEQRRFRLRVTKEAIHVYVVEMKNAEDFPLGFYLSTFYADGAPAECEVAIAQTLQDNSSRESFDAEQIAQPLATVKTNRYGVAKVSSLAIAKSVRDSTTQQSYYSPTLRFIARDGKGQAGRHSESFWLGYGERVVVRVETNKTLYRAGEPIIARIESSKPELSLIVDAAQSERVISSRIVKLQDGRATVIIPYSPAFKDEVAVIAYSTLSTDETISGSRTVLYPHNSELSLDVKLHQTTYRPGEEARAFFQIKDASGRPVESALGVVVIDKAVEERARTNQEFGSSYGFYDSFMTGEQLAGVSRKDLDSIDLSKPLPDGLELVAEMILNNRGDNSPRVYGESDYETDQRKLFGRVIEPQMKLVREALSSRYSQKREYPASELDLRRFLGEAKISFDELRDPWSVAYRAAFSTAGRMSALEIKSCGADKRCGTPDDFEVTRMSWPYFLDYGRAVDRAVVVHHKKTGGYLRDIATLGSELLKEGIDIDRLRDPWGNPYAFEFGIEGSHFTVTTKSSGANRRFDASGATDDVIVWTAKIDYFEETRAKLDAAVGKYFKETSRFPQSEDELKEALKQSGIEWESLRDAWGNRYYAGFMTRARYSDRVTIQSYARYLEKLTYKTEVTPVTEQINYIVVRSAGKDGLQGTADDFTAASLSRIVAEQSSKGEAAKTSSAQTTFSGATGAISGQVADPSGAVIPGAKVTAIHDGTSAQYEGVSDYEGRYILRNLPAGMYKARFESPGFQITMIVDVPVRSSAVTELNVTLDVGSTAESVNVTASGLAVVQRETSLDGASSKFPQIAKLQPGVAASRPAQMATPRLREYFPETILWQPSLETDAQGRARLRFKLADNITTWKVGVIASTVNGEIGIAEKELRAFQPFFIEHDPPRVLTEGDRISLPVVLRNYLDKKLSLDVEMKPENWFALDGPSRKRSEVAAGDVARETFDFRVIASTDKGRQRITAAGAAASDAIEKPVTAHPDGEEIIETASQVFNNSTTLEVNITEAAIKNSARAELKIYPNLMAHVIESIEAIMRRPYGCAEQTISSAYPSLLALRYYKQRGEELPAVAQKAKRYLQAGYERLLNYRSEDGGFSYWGRGDADTALTAYALRFLNDAREFIAVDEEIITSAQQWLIKRQEKDGRWAARYWSSAEEKSRSAMLTSLVARALASTMKQSTIDSDKNTKAALTQAIDYLAARSAEINEPYMIASTALAAFDAGELDKATEAVDKLRLLARNEGDASYWSLETNTPFYGWGRAGRIETTALAVQSLARRDAANGRRGDAETVTDSPRHQDLINRGLLFLIRQKDRYGVWYSTQATVNALDALTSLLSRNEAADGKATATEQAEVFVNGKRAASAAMPRANNLSSHVTIDLSEFLSTGLNRVEIRRSGSSVATAQLVASYYSTWTADKTTKRRVEHESSSALRLKVSFDKTEAGVNDEISCRVEAERVGHRGYGMMLAEIGLPPGAEVDRSSLERAMKESGWAVNQYDVLPDRVILYLWPQAGGVKLDFKFRPRFGLAAKTAPSTIYDYYNPEARVVIAPAKFIVK